MEIDEQNTNASDAMMASQPTDSMQDVEEHKGEGVINVSLLKMVSRC